MSNVKQLEKKYPLEVILLASPVYWPEDESRRALFSEISEAMGINQKDDWKVICIDSDAGIEAIESGPSKSARVVVALSGGIQPWMLRITTCTAHIGLFNAYLPEALPAESSGKLMHANAHPSSTDFFAHCRLESKPVQWLSTLNELREYATAWQAVSRLKKARILKIGETEPWVINSCRSPETIAARAGTEVIPVEREELYAIYRNVSEDEGRIEAEHWLQNNPQLIDIAQDDVVKACRVTVAMRKLLEERKADGLSMACFAMIGDIDTTSCLSLSALNDSATAIGACEGDLDAALTLFLLKSLGADFVWIANPIIHQNNVIDLAHCTAPTCGCGSTLSYRLMRHHESGRGVSPEVTLPDAKTASAVRVSINAREIACHVGLTENKDKLPACHTQTRLHVQSTKEALNSLLGTHLVISFGDYGKYLEYAAAMLGFGYTLTRREPAQQ